MVLMWYNDNEIYNQRNIKLNKVSVTMEQSEYYTYCVDDLMKHYKERDFIQMAFDYDEIQLLKGIKMEAAKTFFTDVKENYIFEVSSSILSAIEYNNEPILVSLNHKWKTVHYDTMYEGAKIDDECISALENEPVEMINISDKKEIKLDDKSIALLDIEPGDIILIEAMSEGFVISRFIEDNIMQYYR